MNLDPLISEHIDFDRTARGIMYTGLIDSTSP
ncbi:unnamed protein product, partial [Allacma fusca]